MKPRLFSTLRCLQHENPLVSRRVVIKFCSISNINIGSTTHWQYTAFPAGSPRTEEDQEREQGDRGFFRKGRSRKIYNCRFGRIGINWKHKLSRCSQSCTGLRPQWPANRHTRYRHIWTFNTDAVEPFRRASIIRKSVFSLQS